MEKILADLNEPQQAAVQHTEGPLLILAGAGSGKTRTLTHRIAYLLQKQKIAPSNILAVTFTNKAAAEMRKRVLKLLGKAEANRTFMPFLGTFHSICVRILRKEASYLGFSSSFVIFDEIDSLSAIKQAMRQLQIDEKKYQPRLIRNLISSAKNELIDPKAYTRLASGPAQEIAASVYSLYVKLLRQAAAFDFDDLLLETAKLFKKYPDVLKKWQQQFRYILVDEYQDTNHAQYEIVKQLAKAHSNICVVGDDWQSIYSWRGANYRNILEFERDWPKAKIIKLEQNYRSTKPILDAAQAVITKNEKRSTKELWTARNDGLPVQVWPVSNEAAEAELIVRTIQDAMTARKRKLNDYAILYRTNAQSRILEEAFVRYGMPYRIVGGVKFYERKEIKDILAYLRLIYQPGDMISWQRVINVPPRGLGEKSRQTFLAWQTSQALSMTDALVTAGLCSGLTTRAANAFKDFGNLLIQLQQASQRLSLEGLFELIIKRSGYLEYLDDGNILAADRIENVKELISVARNYEDVGLDGFLEEVALISEIDSYDEQAEAVTLMTLHAAKGLEFPVVFIGGMEEGVFPHSRSLFSTDEMEEERRLCYVGMTRAREELHLIHAASRLLYGSAMHNPPARFISELTQAAPATKNTPEYDQTEPELRLHLKVSDRVNHPQFGIGTVVSIDEDEIAVIFRGQGTKRLSLDYASLEKLE